MEELKPKIVFWEATKACNLNCIHCSNNSGKPLKNELTTKEAKKLMEELIKAGTEELRLYGGEPLLRKDLFEIAKYAKTLNPKLALSLYTNGTIMTLAILSSLKELEFKKIYLSIHDSRPVINDLITQNHGSLKKLVETANQLKGFNIGANFTISKLNMDGIRDTFDFAKETLHANTMHVSILTNVGRAKKHAELQLTKTDLKNLADAVPKTYLDYFGGQQARLCEAATKRIMISADGEVYPCPLFIEPKFSAGNVRKQSFEKIWEKPRKCFGEVRDSILKSGVDDGCRSRAYYLTGCLGGEDFYWEQVKQKKASK